MSVTGIGPVKAAGLALDAAALRDIIIPLIHVDSRENSVREHVRKFCMDTGVPI
jgi:phosphotransferase system enzyme I (PtsP)